jgi:hypothetical protein
VGRDASADRPAASGTERGADPRYRLMLVEEKAGLSVTAAGGVGSSATASPP